MLVRVRGRGRTRGTVHGHDLPLPLAFLQHAGRHALALDRLGFVLEHDGVTVGFGRQRDRSFQTYGDGVVGELERRTVAQLRADVMVAVVVLPTFDLPRFHHLVALSHDPPDAGTVHRLQ